MTRAAQKLAAIRAAGVIFRQLVRGCGGVSDQKGRVTQDSQSPKAREGDVEVVSPSEFHILPLRFV